MNKQLVALPYKKYGLEVYESGINIVVNISRLEAKISYNGLSFSIRLPYKLFGNNTKGQCGESPLLAPLSLEGKTGCEPLSPREGKTGCEPLSVARMRVIFPLWTVTVAMSCVWSL